MQAARSPVRQPRYVPQLLLPRIRVPDITPAFAGFVSRYRSDTVPEDYPSLARMAGRTIPFADLSPGGPATGKARPGDRVALRQQEAARHCAADRSGARNTPTPERHKAPFPANSTFNRRVVVSANRRIRL